MSPEQETKLNQIHKALVGDELGNPGLVKRVNDLETYKKDDEKYKNKAVGFLAAITLIWSAFINWLIKHS